MTETDPEELELERAVSRALSRLPEPKAPPGLLPRVLEAPGSPVVHPRLAWDWRSWPLRWRIAWGTLLGVLVVAIHQGLAVVEVSVGGIASGLLEGLTRLGGTLDPLGDPSVRALVSVIGTLEAPVMELVLAIVLVMLALILVVGTAIFNTARGGPLQT